MNTAGRNDGNLFPPKGIHSEMHPARLSMIFLLAAAPAFAGEGALNNVASSALVVAYNTEKNGYTCVPWDNPVHPAAGAVDGVIAGSPENPNAEWATKGLTVGAQLCLTWSKPVRIQKVRLFDRPNPDDQIISGEILTDCGKRYAVGTLDNAGKIPATIAFDGTPVKQLTFRVTGVSAATLNAGLAEIEALSPDKMPETLEQILTKPVYDENPGFIELHDLAWKQAKDHIRLSPGLPRPLYMDEACWDNTLWIWDTCYMAMYCRYAPSMFPGVESLDNFYGIIHDGVKTPLRIEMLDNPPLYAWAEYDTYRMTGDKTRLSRVVLEKQYLQKDFAWRDTVKAGTKLPNVDHHRVIWTRDGDGYRWNAGFSGMDNTPRGRGAKNGILWVDAIAQQGLAALSISRLAESLGDKALAAEWRAKHGVLRDLVNTKYWDKKDGFYYDIDRKTGEFSKVATPASFWPMMAEMATPEQAAAMADKVRDARWFGGEYPWPSLVSTDPKYTVSNNKHGEYWRGGVWLPMVYMGVKSLDKYGYRDLARETSVKTLEQMLRTYRDFKPATIWECYSPIADRPSTEHGAPTSRPDFCGWSALGPISLLIEDIIGIHTVDAETRLVQWRLVSKERTGVRNLRFGSTVTDLVAEKDGSLAVKSTAPYTLEVNGAKFSVKAGDNTFRVTRAE